MIMIIKFQNVFLCITRTIRTRKFSMQSVQINTLMSHCMLYLRTCKNRRLPYPRSGLRKSDPRRILASVAPVQIEEQLFVIYSRLVGCVFLGRTFGGTRNCSPAVVRRRTVESYPHCDSLKYLCRLLVLSSCVKLCRTWCPYCFY